MYHGPTLQSPTNQKEHYGVSWDETRFQNDKLSIMANKNEIAQASLLVSYKLPSSTSSSGSLMKDLA